MQTTFPISQKDAHIIAQVVELFTPKIDTISDYQECKLHLLRIFGTDITPDHYIMLGQVIGLKSATDNKQRQKSNYHNNDRDN